MSTDCKLARGCEGSHPSMADAGCGVSIRRAAEDNMRSVVKWAELWDEAHMFLGSLATSATKPVQPIAVAWRAGLRTAASVRWILSGISRLLVPKDCKLARGCEGSHPSMADAGCGVSSRRAADESRRSEVKWAEV